MAPRRDPELILLQAVVAIACLVPLGAGLAGILQGPAMIPGVEAVPVSLDSHYRYMSGIFLGVGLLFAWTVPGIERKGAAFRLGTALVVLGGLARLLSLELEGPPGTPHLLGLGMELVVVPSLALWQARVARRHGQ